MKQFNRLAKMDFIENDAQKEDEVIHLKGKLLCKVFRKAKVGDYIRFHNLHRSDEFKVNTINGKLYKVFKSGGYEDGGVYFDEEGIERDVLGWERNPIPDVYEICGVYEKAPYIPSKIVNNQQDTLTKEILNEIVSRIQQFYMYKEIYQPQVINYYFGLDSASIQLTEDAFLSIFSDYTFENYDDQYMKLTALINGVELFCLQEK
ncbi:hypothetical protein ACQKMD_06965 [Viridibacillus sp. NPDC096237]|uniref:hypothetical protein n=1 Tax=Viridibacillus sp. NPDC096237 TaxID=3390721 RepID=UPI003D002DF8